MPDLFASDGMVAQEFDVTGSTAAPAWKFRQSAGESVFNLWNPSSYRTLNPRAACLVRTSIRNFVHESESVEMPSGSCRALAEIQRSMK